jgi:hypothetical protein
MMLKTENMMIAAANLRQMEIEHGFAPIEVASWLNNDDWREIIATRDHRRVRLVLLDAKQPGTGAFTRLIAGITKAGLVPVIVEPNKTLTDWCVRHGYRMRIIGKGKDRHEVWYLRRSAY